MRARLARPGALVLHTGARGSAHECITTSIRPESVLSGCGRTGVGTSLVEIAGFDRWVSALGWSAPSRSATR